MGILRIIFFAKIISLHTSFFAVALENRPPTNKQSHTFFSHCTTNNIACVTIGTTIASVLYDHLIPAIQDPATKFVIHSPSVAQGIISPIINYIASHKRTALIGGIGTFATVASYLYKKHKNKKNTHAPSPNGNTPQSQETRTDRDISLPSSFDYLNKMTKLRKIYQRGSCGTITNLGMYNTKLGIYKPGCNCSSSPVSSSTHAKNNALQDNNKNNSNDSSSSNNITDDHYASKNNPDNTTSPLQAFARLIESKKYFENNLSSSNPAIEGCAKYQLASITQNFSLQERMAHQEYEIILKPTSKEHYNFIMQKISTEKRVNKLFFRAIEDFKTIQSPSCKNASDVLIIIRTTLGKVGAQTILKTMYELFKDETGDPTLSLPHCRKITDIIYWTQGRLEYRKDEKYNDYFTEDKVTYKVDLFSNNGKHDAFELKIPASISSSNNSNAPIESSSRERAKNLADSIIMSNNNIVTKKEQEENQPFEEKITREVVEDIVKKSFLKDDFIGGPWRGYFFPHLKEQDFFEEDEPSTLLHDMHKNYQKNYTRDNEKYNANLNSYKSQLICTYKIHLMPANQAQLNSVVQALFQERQNNSTFKNAVKIFKILENFTFSSDKNTMAESLKQETSNIFPIIVIYPYRTQGKNGAQCVLNTVYKLFSSMEGCNITPRFNQKISSLIFWAQGNGDHKKIEKYKYLFSKNRITYNPQIFGDGQELQHPAVSTIIVRPESNGDASPEEMKSSINFENHD